MGFLSFPEILSATSTVWHINVVSASLHHKRRHTEYAEVGSQTCC